MCFDGREKHRNDFYFLARQWHDAEQRFMEVYEATVTNNGKRRLYDMNRELVEYAYQYVDAVCEDKSLVLDIGLEPWELHNAINTLSLDETAWHETAFRVEGYKSFNEEGSYVVGILMFDGAGKTAEDFYVLAEAIAYASMYGV